VAVPAHLQGNFCGRLGVRAWRLVADGENLLSAHGLSASSRYGRASRGPTDAARGQQACRDPVHPAVAWIFLLDTRKLPQARDNLLDQQVIGVGADGRLAATWRKRRCGSGALGGWHPMKGRRANGVTLHSRSNWAHQKQNDRSTTRITRWASNGLAPHLICRDAHPRTLRGWVALLRLAEAQWSSFIAVDPAGWSLAVRGAPSAALRRLLIGLGRLPPPPRRRRFAGCVANDFWAGRIDPLVERTKDDPSPVVG